MGIWELIDRSPNQFAPQIARPKLETATKILQEADDSSAPGFS